MEAFRLISDFFSPSSQGGVYSLYTISKSDHYKNLLFPRTIEDVVSRFKNTEKQILATSQKIQFNGLSLGCDLNILLDQKGNANYHMKGDSCNLFDYDVLFYKEKLARHHVLAQYHFVDGKLILGTFLFNSNLDRKEIKEVEKAILNKYAISESGIDFKKVFIEDEIGNKIEIINEVYTGINYFLGDESLFSSLHEKINKYKKLSKLPSDIDREDLHNKL